MAGVKTITIEELASLVTEQGNPGNLRNVVRALVEVPSPRLKQGIVLVDTPGLGSLARRGAAETLAYLPACDLALLLIDAGTTLNEEDIGTLRLLYEAGIPALVLLSKADLLDESDLRHAIQYIEEQLQSELGNPRHVHPVSSLPDRHGVCSTNSSSGSCFPVSSRRGLCARIRLQERSAPFANP